LKQVIALIKLSRKIDNSHNGISDALDMYADDQVLFVKELKSKKIIAYFLK